MPNVPNFQSLMADGYLNYSQKIGVETVYLSITPEELYYHRTDGEGYNLRVGCAVRNDKIVRHFVEFIGNDCAEFAAVADYVNQWSKSAK